LPQWVGLDCRRVRSSGVLITAAVAGLTLGNALSHAQALI